MTAIIYALIYTIIVFAFGFAFGIVRTKFIVPSIGKAKAVMLELPFIIAISYFVVQILNFQIPTQERQIIAMSSFIFLMGIEYLFAHFMFKMNFQRFFARYKKNDAQIGLAGQIIFSLLPLIIK